VRNEKIAKNSNKGVSFSFFISSLGVKRGDINVSFRVFTFLFLQIFQPVVLTLCFFIKYIRLFSNNKTKYKGAKMFSNAYFVESIVKQRETELLEQAKRIHLLKAAKRSKIRNRKHISMPIYRFFKNLGLRLQKRHKPEICESPSA
jgi:hypothetical protein